MNLLSKPFSLRHLLVKIIAYVAGFYILLMTASVAITGYIFLNLEGYRSRIETTVYKHTGYKLNVKSIETKLNSSFLPEITITDVNLVNPINSKQKVHVDKLDFVFSYSSIWDLEPIFNKILIDGTNIDIEYDPSGNIFVNGINVNNPDKQTLENTKNSPIDLERWVLKQHQIVLDHINLSYLDSKNDIPLVRLNNIRLGLEKKIWSKHYLYLDIYGKTYKNMLKAELDWEGGKFEDWQNWNSAKLVVKSINGNDNLVNTLQQYVPQISPVNEFNATTALEANIQKGKIENLNANFDVNNFRVAMADANLVNFPKLGGNIKIRLLNNQYYTINAKDLTIVTGAGALFNNASVTGGYDVGKSGQIELSNTNLVAINNFLSLFKATDGISIDGTIQSVKYNWDGYFLKPRDFQVYAAFNDISLDSTKDSLPSMSHVSGDISIRKDAGSLNLKLKDSVLNYPHLFLIPYVFKNFDSNITWNIESHGKVNVVLHKTNLETKDFKGWAEGNYHTEPDNPDSVGYMALKAHLERTPVHAVGYYLPKSIPMSVLEWLQMGLASGYANNADLNMYGGLNDFPYKNGKGLFYITADIDNAKLNYVKNWPALENIKGKFTLKNTSIIVDAASATIENNHLDMAHVVIPDFSSESGVYLTALGKAHGSTTNFLNYIAKTPIDKIIGGLSEKLIAEGNGNLDLYLKVPFSEPALTEVKGTYMLINNRALFKMPIPLLNAVNGDINFSNHGVDIKSLRAEAFDSRAIIAAKTESGGTIHFNVNAPKVDYRKLAQFYLPPIEELIEGKSDTQIRFDINKQGISNFNASSSLVGVMCSAAEPLKKAESIPAAINFNLKPISHGTYLASFKYANRLNGQVILGATNITNRVKLAVGDAGFMTDPDPGVVMTINANPETTNILDWLSTIKKMILGINEGKELKADESRIPSYFRKAITSNTTVKAEQMVFPAQLQLSSSDIKFGKISLEAGTANVFIDKTSAYFNIYTPIVSGVGNYNYKENNLLLTLDKFMLFKKAPKKLESGPINFENGTESAVNMKVPSMKIAVNNLFYQNHNLGKLGVNIEQQGKDLLIESGLISSKDGTIGFSGANYCFGCGRDNSSVDFRFNAQIADAGNILYALDLGRILDKGRGTINGSVQWNGGFQDFSPLRMIGSVNADFASGKLLKVDPGVWGGLLSVINLQGIYEVGSMDVQDLFKKGFFFNTLEVNADILASQIELKHVYLAGPLAQVNSNGMVDFANNNVDAYLSITPRLGFAIALTAGVATLNPLIGLGVYLGELVLGSPQNKLFTIGYHISGNLNKPKIEKTGVKQQFVKNVNSAVGNSNGGN